MIFAAKDFLLSRDIDPRSIVIGHQSFPKRGTFVKLQVLL